MKTKKEIIDKVWTDLDKTRLTSQISDDLISDVVDSVLKAINYSQCCAELKAVDITGIEDIPDPYWKEYIEGKQ